MAWFTEPAIFHMRARSRGNDVWLGSLEGARTPPTKICASLCPEVLFRQLSPNPWDSPSFATSNNVQKGATIDRCTLGLGRDTSMGEYWAYLVVGAVCLLVGVVIGWVAGLAVNNRDSD